MSDAPTPLATRRSHAVPADDDNVSFMQLKVFQASPLAYKDFRGKEIAIPMLDSEVEEAVWREACDPAGTSYAHADFELEVATANSLGTHISEGNRFLYFSWQGHHKYLFIEDGYGGGQRLLVDHNLQGWIRAGGQQLSFVFVLSWHSRSTGEAFVAAGVPHVVCCERDALNNIAATAFSRYFHRAVATGKTLKQAFDLAIYGVIHSAELEKSGVDQEKEAEKFALLPEKGVDHDIPLFGPSSITQQMSLLKKKKGPAPRKKPPLPFPPQIFLGREVDLYRIMKQLFVKKARLVWITGGPGIGKLSLAKALAQYIDKRTMWGSTVWLPSPLVGMSNNEAISLLSQVFDMIEDSKVPADGLRVDNNYRSMSRKLLNLVYEGKLVVIINTKELSTDSLIKLSVFLDDFFEHTKNTKVVLVQSDANPPIKSKHATGFPCEQSLVPLSFNATLMLFARVCPLSYVPYITEYVLLKKKSTSKKELYKVLGNGIPSFTLQIAQKMTQEEFDELLKLDGPVDSSSFRCSINIVEALPDELMDVVPFREQPQLFPCQANATEPDQKPSQPKRLERRESRPLLTPSEMAVLDQDEALSMGDARPSLKAVTTPSTKQRRKMSDVPTPLATPRSQLGDPLEAAGIPVHDKNGTLFSLEERAAMAKKKGLCSKCGVQTHKPHYIKGFSKKKSITNADVHKGICIRCYKDDVPLGVYLKWQEKNPSKMGRDSIIVGAASPRPRSSKQISVSEGDKKRDSASSINVTVEPDADTPSSGGRKRDSSMSSSINVTVEPEADSRPLKKAVTTQPKEKSTIIRKSVSVDSSSSHKDPREIYEAFKRETSPSSLNVTTKRAVSVAGTISTSMESASTVSDVTNADSTSSSILLKVFQASPLAYEDYTGKEIAIPYLDLETEETLLKEALEGSRIDVSSEIATANSLGTFLSEGNQLLHFSCHGHPKYLFIEDGYGGGQRLLVDHNLQGWIRAGGQQLSFVFVSACHSRSAGEAFVEAGIQHVVCCEQDGQMLSNTAALVFSRDFYKAVAHGKTLKQAFDLAIYGVIHSGELARKGVDQEKEAEKFALLPEKGVDHDIPLFGPSSITQQSWLTQSWLTKSSKTAAPKKKSMLPFPPQIFLGREVDLYRIMKQLFVKKARLVQITGGPGIGKLSLAKALGQYIEKRTMWGSTVWLPLPLVGMSSDEAISLLSQVFDMIEDPKVPADGLEVDNNYRSMSRKLLNLVYEGKLVVIINTKELSTDSLIKLSVFLDDFFEHTKNTKVVLVQSDANPPIKSKHATGFPCFKVEHSLVPLSFNATLTLFARVCPLSSNPHITKDLLIKKKSENKKELYKVLGNGIPSFTLQIAQAMPQEEFDELLKLEGTVDSSSFRCSINIVEALPDEHMQAPELLHSSSRGALASFADTSSDGGLGSLDVVPFRAQPQLFPYQADVTEPDKKPSQPKRLERRESRSTLSANEMSVLDHDDMSEPGEMAWHSCRTCFKHLPSYASGQLPRPNLSLNDWPEDEESDELPPLRSQEEVFSRFAPLLRKEGKIHRKILTYQSIRKVWARKVDEKDMDFFCHGVKDGLGGWENAAYFSAPWGELLVEQGDYMVMEYPEVNEEVYRIKHHAFHYSYVEFEEAERRKKAAHARKVVAISAGLAVVAFALHRLFFSKRK